MKHIMQCHDIYLVFILSLMSLLYHQNACCAIKPEFHDINV